MSAPRILIVDDQRDISRMLRAALETLGQGYVIVDVPSAEEAQLEMRRGPVDLLITDLRLPGISGLELIRRLHKASNAAQIFVISAYADEIAQAEFRDLGATFFAKPLDLHAFLRAVQQALGSRESAAATPPTHDEQTSLAGRLARLRRDLGALAACLVSLDGRIVAQAGEAPNLDLPALTPPLMEAFRASLRVSRALGGQTPANAQIFDGAACAAYSANVGEHFALLMVFDGQRAAGQMGPVLRYGRLAADDLLNTLRNLGVEGGDFPPAAAQAAEPAVAKGATVAKTAAFAKTTPPPPPPAPASAAPAPARRKKTGPLRKKTGPLPPAPAATTAAPPAEPAPAGEKAPAGEEAPSPEAPAPIEAPAQKTTSQAAADYWEGVDGAEIGDHRTDTLTWEQAAKLGIVPPKT